MTILNMEHALSKFHVVTMISNPVRYESRYKLYDNFERRLKCAGAKLWTAEVAFGDRPYQINSDPAHRLLRYRTFDEIWHKENALNLAISRLPEDWEYVAWIDADILFHNPNWVEETVQQLQHYMVVQMFGDAIDLGPQMQPMQMHRGFVKGYIDEGYKNPNKRHPKGWPYYGGVKGSFAHTGFAWAARREALEAVGGLIDFAILGSADHNMALGLIGHIDDTYPTQMHSRYIQKMLRWQERADKYIKHDIGFVPGTISHYWHGKKKDRKYVERWKILIDNGFDPDLDLKRDTQGLWTWTDNNPRLRDEVRSYFRQRNEDSIDL